MKISKIISRLFILVSLATITNYAQEFKLTTIKTGISASIEMPHLFSIFPNKFTENAIFQANFDDGKLGDGWKIVKGKWYIANLDEKGIKPPEGENNFALASAGDSEIMIDVPFENMNPAVPVQLNFTYWVHSKGSKGLVRIDFVNKKGGVIESKQFEELPEKGKWDNFNQTFQVSRETSRIRLILGEKAGAGLNTVYFKKIILTPESGGRG